MQVAYLAKTFFFNIAHFITCNLNVVNKDIIIYIFLHFI